MSAQQKAVSNWKSAIGQGDDETTVGAEGTMRYFDDLKINMESAELLIPLEVCQVQQIGEMHKDGFVEGWKAVG